MNALVTGALGVLALAGLEVYLRLSIPDSSKESIYESTLTTRRYKLMKPDARIIAWGSELRTNSLGFRAAGSGPLPPRPASGYRIVLLGDSFSVAAGVDFDRIYTSLVQKSLRERVPGAEVINLAVGGYNIIQYELVLDEVALPLQPDMVVVAVFPFNDLSNDTYRANFEDASGASQPRPPVPWYRELYVYRAFISRAEARLMAMFRAQDTAAPAATDETLKTRDAEENLAALTRIVKTVTSRGLDVVVAILPNTDDFGMQEGRFAPFKTLCRESGWRCVDLRDPFVAAGDSPKALRLHLLDAHPNETYNVRVAQALSDYLMPLIESGRNTSRLD